MKKIIITAFLGLCLMGCNSYNAILPTTRKIPTIKTIKDMNKIQAESKMVTTETPSTPPEISSNTDTQEETLLLPGTEIFAFSENEQGWYTVDDNVMGGVSSSTVDIIDSNILFFSGTMSLDNNGGFSSIRSDWTPTNLTGSDGILLRVLGDGKMYRLRIRSAETGSNISYNAIFETTPETWELVYIPFASMVPTYRGFVMDVDPLNPASIGSFGFMLSDKQPGEFELQVDWIRAISEEDLPLTGTN